jgi:phosphotransferase system IIB component
MSCIYDNPLRPKIPSKLHSELIDRFGEKKAAEVFALTDTPGFKKLFGDWKQNDKLPLDSEARLDTNRLYESGEPKLFENKKTGHYYFIKQDGKKFYIDRKILNFSLEAREALVQSVMVEAFAGNTYASAEVFDGVDLNKVFERRDKNSIYLALGQDLQALKDLRKLTVTRLRTMGFKVKETVEDVDNDEDITQLAEEAEQSAMIDLTPQMERNSKDNASANIKFFLMFIPERDMNGKPKFKTIELTPGVPFKYISFVPFDKIYKQFQETLKDMTVTFNEGKIIGLFDQMIDRMQEQYKTDPTVTSALKVLKSFPPSKQNEFVHAFRLHLQNFDTNLITRNGSNFTYRSFLSADTTKPSKAVKDEWLVQFEKSPLIKKATQQTSVSPTNLQTFTNHSGGAVGADTQWDVIGQQFGMVNNKHYYFEGFKTPKGNEAIPISLKNEADAKLQKANETLGRRFPTSKEYVNNLLRRNWWQVKNSDAIFAVSTITNNKVDGGTGWAVHMAIGENKPVYVYDQVKEKWFTWKSGQFIEIGTPKLTKNFAGIGTREINEAGKRAIKEVYQNTLTGPKTISEGTPIFNVEKAQSNAVKFKALKDEYERVRKDATDETLLSIAKRARLALHTMGVTVSPESFGSFIESFGGDTKSNLTNAITRLNFLFQDMATLKNEDVVKNKDIKNIFSNAKLSKNINLLADHQAKFNKDLSENTVMGAEGKTYWLYTLPSYLHEKVQRLKLDPNSEIPMKSGFYGNSLWADLFRDPENNSAFINSFQLRVFGNFREEFANDEGTDNKKITKQDQTVDQMNKTLLGVKDNEKSVFYTPTPADKGKLIEIVGPQLYTWTLNNGVISEQIIDVFAGYALDEVKRIKEELVLLDDIEGNQSKFYKDYHFKLGDGNVPYFYAYMENGKEKLTNDKNKTGVYLAGNAFRTVLFKEINPFESSSQLFSKGKLIVSDDKFKNDPVIREIISNELKLTIEKNKLDLMNQGLYYFRESRPVLHGLDKGIQDKYTAGADYNVAVEAMLGDYVINNMIVNVEFSKLFSGDYAYYKNMVDYSKRVPATYTDGTYLNLQTGDNATFKVAVMPDVKIPSKTFKDVENISPYLASTYVNNVVNQTDAQGWITLDRWEFIMSRSNHWNPKYEQALERFRNNTQTAEDYKLAAQPIKGVYFDNIDGVPTYIKYSAAVLIPSAIKGTALERLNNDMLSQGISEAVVVDGIKVGAKIPSDILDNGNIKEGKLTFNTITLRNNSYKIQQDLRPKGIRQTLIGSQLKKVLLTNIVPDVDYDGISGSELRQEFMDMLSDLSNKGLKELERTAGIDSEGNIVNKELLTEKLIDQLIERGASNNLIEALEKEYDYDYIANYRQKMQNGIMALINNTTVKIKANGASFIQMSSFGMDQFEAEMTGVKMLVEPGHLKAPTLVEYTDENGNVKKKVLPGQVFVTSSMISKYIPNWKEISASDLKKIIDKEAFKMVGYRIPNQGMSSNDSLEIVGILPESFGDTIVPYMDITTKTGSDFDIDKMYVIIPNVRPVYEKATYKKAKEFLKRFRGDTIQSTTDTLMQILDDHGITQDPTDFIKSIISKSELELLQDTTGDVIQEVLFGDNELAEQFKKEYGIGEIKRLEYIKFDRTKPASAQSKKAVENRFIELAQQILESEHTYDALMKSIDSNALKKDIGDLHGTETESVNNEFFAPAYQLQKKFDNSGGKNGVGITANQLVDHMWSQKDEVTLPVDIGLGHVKYGLTDLSQIYDINGKEKGNKITDVISWFLNAYVDIAKDPYISKGNHNEYTASTVFMMIRSGVPISFINRFVGQEGIKELALQDSLRKSRVSDADVFVPLIDDAQAALIRKYNLNSTEVAGTYNTLEEQFNKLSELEGVERIKAVNTFAENLEKLIKTDSKSAGWASRQISLMKIFQSMKEQGDILNNAIMASKQDVNGGGKDFMSAYVNKNKVAVAKANTVNNFSARFKDTFLGTAYENSTELAINVFENLFVTANKSAQMIYDTVYGIITNDGNGLQDEELGFDLEKAYFAHILGETPIMRNQAELREMLMGDNSVQDRVMSAKVMLPDNYFLSKLKPQTFSNIKFVTVENSKNSSVEEMNELSRSWEEMFDNKDPFIRELANDLVSMSYYQSGFKTNLGSFFQHIPTNKLREIVEPGIANAKLAYAGGYAGVHNFVDKYFRHNWNDNKIVPSVRGKKQGNILIVPVRDNNGKFNKNYNRPYVKVKLRGELSDTYTLYRNEGFIVSPLTGEETQALFVPVSKLGYNSQGRYIYEYGSDVNPDTQSIIASNRWNRPIDKDIQTIQNMDNYIPYSQGKNYLSTIQGKLSVMNNTDNIDRADNDGEITIEC